MKAKGVIKELEALADPADAAHAARYFKAGKGEYGEGDRFFGIRVPRLRQLAKRYRTTPLSELERLLASPWHEARLLALLIMVEQYRDGDEKLRRCLYRSYLDHLDGINNWDLVDTSAEHIVGAWLWQRSRAPLYRLARSPDMWSRRVAIMSTFHFIKQGELDETYRLAEQLIADMEPLLHKAVGWMLRETGKRDRSRLESFLQAHYDELPRTTLRYAIEKFPETLRKRYLQGRF